MSRESLRAETQRHHDELDDYGQSVLGLHVFCRQARFDPVAGKEREDGRYSVPRTMTAAEATEGGGRLTPDAVAQPRGDAYAFVAEMKKNFRPGATRNWDQLGKYDRDLIGWWTTEGSLETHDLVMITHMTTSVNAADSLRQWQDAGGRFTRPIAIIEFAHNNQGQTYFFLRRTVGQLSDPAYDEALRLGIQVPREYVIEALATRKFYDAKPPLIHMLVIIWTNVLPPLVAEESYDPAAAGGPSVTVTAETVRDALSRDFCADQEDERTPELPKIAWVREALDKLVEADLATAVDGAYSVRLRQAGKKDAVEFLTSRLWKGVRQLAGPQPDKQGELFAPTALSDEESS